MTSVFALLPRPMEWLLQTLWSDLFSESEEPPDLILLQTKVLVDNAVVVPSNALFALCGFAVCLLPHQFLFSSPSQSREPKADAPHGAKPLPPVILSLLAFTCGLDFFCRSTVWVMVSSFNEWLVLSNTIGFFLCTDQYQPSMPAMSREFQVAEGSISLSIQTHQVSCGLAALVFGPLSDHIGRRKVLLFLQLLLGLGCLCCGCASSFNWFLVGRMMQGTSASSMTIILAMARDCYENEQERLKVGGLLFGSMLIGPLIAPPIGGFLATRFGWRSSFFLLAGAASGIFLGSCFWLQETAPLDAPKSSYLEAAWRTVANRRRVLLLLLMSLLKSTISILDNNNAFMLESFFGVPLQEASFMLTVLALAGASGVILAALLGRKPAEVMILTMPVVLLVALCDLLVGIFFWNKLWFYFLCTCFQHFVVMLPNVAANAEFLQDLEDIAGMAGCAQTAGVFALGSLLSLPPLLWPPQNGPRPMLCVLAMSVFLSALLAWIICRDAESTALSQSSVPNGESAGGEPEPCEVATH